MKAIIYSIFAGLLLLSFTSFVNPQETVVLVGITNIRSDKGEIQLGVYKDQETFDKEKEYKMYHFTKDKMKGNVLVVKLRLEPGDYGIALLDDENRNGEMDFSLLIPKEGYGFSNYYHKGLKRPDFDNFKFTVGTNTAKVQVKMKYM